MDAFQLDDVLVRGFTRGAQPGPEETLASLRRWRRFPIPPGSGTPVEVILFGNPKFQTEHVVAYEAGFRAQPNTRLSIDVSTFFNHYDHLESLEPRAGSLRAKPRSRSLCHSHHVRKPDVSARRKAANSPRI